MDLFYITANDINFHHQNLLRAYIFSWSKESKAFNDNVANKLDPLDLA